MTDSQAVDRYDVGVVGAGLAGLTAARTLHNAGLDVVVIEARDRVGGRTAEGSLSTGEPIDRGAEWIGSDHQRVLALVEEFDLELCEQYDTGVDRLAVAGELFDHENRFRALPSEAAAELRAGLERIETLGGNRPAEAPEAEMWDATPLEFWKRETMETEAAREAFDALVRAEYCVEPSQLSLLTFLVDAGGDGGFEMDTDSVSTTERYRLAGSTHQLSRRLSDTLGNVVQLRQPVGRIERRSDDVLLVSETAQYAVSDAIVAVPPPLIGHIEHDPPLPARLRGLIQRLPMGAVIKCVVGYEELFWREDGYSGSVLAADGILSEVADGTNPDENQARLIGFIAGSDAVRWSDRPTAERRDHVLEYLCRYFGPQASDPLAYVDEDWSRTHWSTGGYNAVMTPGTLMYGDVLREPVGRVRWAGSETALEWPGFMEGAVSSGQRVANEILTERERRAG